MKHLTDDEVLAVVEQGASSIRARHLEQCQPCRTRVSELTGVLGAVVSDEVPEPSPLFWERFSARVSEAVAAEAEAAQGRVPWWRRRPAWRVLVPLTAVTVAVLLLVTVLLRPPAVSQSEQASRGVPAAAAPVVGQAGEGSRQVPSRGPGLEGEDEEAWQVLSALVSETGEGAEVAVLAPATPGSVDTAVQQLSDEERGELERLLRVEMERHPSRRAG